jgi:outer membrane biosynthesis protein TonB
MQFVFGQPFEEAVSKLGQRSVIGAQLSSSEWHDVPAALRERAFFSSRVESVRFLQRAKDALSDWQTKATEETPGGTALAMGSRADFVKAMQDFLGGEGIVRKSGSVTDLAGEKRLGLIFDVQTRQANDFGYWKQGMDQDTLDMFPAQRFIRVIDVKEPRQAHTDYEDMVFLKTDSVWEKINEDFGVPWGPWGWGCGHDVEDVDREEAVALGLIGETEEVKPAAEQDFNERLEASATNLDEDLLDFLGDKLGDKVVIDRQAHTVKWADVPPPPNAPTAQPKPQMSVVPTQQVAPPQPAPATKPAAKPKPAAHPKPVTPPQPPPQPTPPPAAAPPTAPTPDAAGPSAKPQPATLAIHPAIEAMAESMKKQGFNAELVDATRALPASLGPMMESAKVVKSSKGASYTPADKTVHLNKDHTNWSGRPMTQYHEIGHHLAHESGLVKSDGPSKRLENAMAKDLEQWKQWAQSRHGAQWEALYKGNDTIKIYDDVSQFLNGKKFGTEAGLDDSKRASRIADTVMGLSSGKYGAGHAISYMKKKGFHEAAAHAFSAVMQNDAAYLAMFPEITKLVRKEYQI